MRALTTDLVRRISELKNQSISRDHAIWRTERMNRVSEKWETTKHTNIYIMGVPEKDGGKEKTEENIQKYNG